MMTKEQKIQFLIQSERGLQTRMSALLVKIREANGIKNPFIVSTELGQSTSTIRNIEKGFAFPTRRTLNEIIKAYTMTPAERTEVLRLKDEMLKVRTELKALRKETARK